MVAIARRHRVSLNWLLLNEGPESLDACASGADLPAVLHDVLSARLSSSLGIRAERIDRALPSRAQLLEDILADYTGKVRKIFADQRRNRASMLEIEERQVIGKLIALTHRVARGEKPRKDAQQLIANIRPYDLLNLTPDGRAASEEREDTVVGLSVAAHLRSPL